MPKQKSHRSLRVADSIQRSLADSLRKVSQELKLGMVTISDVEVSSDLSFAKVFVSAISTDKSPEEIVKSLNQEAPIIRTMLAKTMTTRATPKLKFLFDHSITEGHRISRLIDDAISDDES